MSFLTLLTLFITCVSMLSSTQITNRILKFVVSGDFINDLQKGRFSYEKYVGFLTNLPFNKNSTLDSVKDFVTPLFDLFDKNIDLIAEEYMKQVDLKHGSGDVKKNLKVNIKVSVLARINYLGVNARSLLPPHGADAMSYISGDVISGLPTSLLFIPFGIEQGYYVDYSQFPIVTENEFFFDGNVKLQPGKNLAEYADKVMILSQQCGSCLAFSSAAVLTHFFIRFYKNQKEYDSKFLETTPNIFIEPYHLLACVNNELPVGEHFRDIYSRFFPRSNGYYAGHGCFGGMSPEMLFWAKHNTNKLGFIGEINDTELLAKDRDFSNSISKNHVKLGKFCDKATKNVRQLPYPFPKFEIKHIPRTIFNKKSKKNIAELLYKIINKYGFVMASLYYSESGHLFDCKVLEKERETTQTYHYVAIAGVKYDNTDPKEEKFKLLIHNSWGGNSYDEIQIFDNFMDCNSANGLFVLEPIY